MSLHSKAQVIIYNVFIVLYGVAIRIAALWNKKAKEWLTGRKNLFEELSNKISAADKIIWVHCSSGGEFEQGKPIIEQLKRLYPNHRVLVTFFSPSGYKAARKYPYADIISYLPEDTSKNASHFVKLVHPQLVIFVKYDFWYHHLSVMAFNHIPLLLASATFRKEQVFFKKYGSFYRQMLFFFRHLFVQDQPSLQLLKTHYIDHCSISGDTRFDRVKKIATEFSEIPNISLLALHQKIIVAGSTWPRDEEIIAGIITLFPAYKWIIAPHEINEHHLQQIEKLIPQSYRYSKLEKTVILQESATLGNDDRTKEALRQWDGTNAIIMDNIGMLSRLYKYGTVAYVGGGFTRDGIHNILEAAVYGKPVLFGPNYKKYREAKELIRQGGAFSFSSSGSLIEILKSLLNQPAALQKAGKASEKYIMDNTGATQNIIQFIQANRLLTN